MYITNTLKIINGSDKEIECNGEFGDKKETIKIGIEDNGNNNTFIIFVETNGDPVYIGWDVVDEETGTFCDVSADDSDWDFDSSWFTEEELNEWVRDFKY
jgi:hypothetical protein